METKFVKKDFFYQIKKLSLFILPVLVLSLSISMTMTAAEFDPAYYATTYPDVVASNDLVALKKTCQL